MTYMIIQSHKRKHANLSIYSVCDLLDWIDFETYLIAEFIRQFF